jgi:MerR family transcriptional regulator, light-induced transcriptional regulator
MNMLMDELLVEAKKLPAVTLAAAAAYKHHVPVLTKYVDDKLISHPRIHSLIGNNPLQIMFDNHKNHVEFMSTVFSLGDYELLCKTVPWVYRSYHAHKFSYDYFPVELKAWQEAIAAFIDPGLTDAIRIIYDWMIGNHERFITLSQSDMSFSIPVEAGLLAVKSSFQSALIAGDHRKCLSIAVENVNSSPDIEIFYGQVIQPVMYEIGSLWERGELSVAQEHLAAAIVGRIMATISMTRIEPRGDKGKAVVTASPNEFHEIGAWMIADILKIQGWDVDYLGANTPQNDLVQFLLSSRPDVLAISVTMPFNVEKVKDIIDLIKPNPVFNKMKIMVGGRVFIEHPSLGVALGADGFGINIADVKRLASQWEKK